MKNDLPQFIEHARSKGMDHGTIRMLLLSAGWKERDIAKALSEEGLDMPVPVPVDAGGARDAFLHLITFASLYVTVISTAVLFFTFINRLFPDYAMQRFMSDAYLTGVRMSMAAIIVSFPLYLWTTRLLLREMGAHAEKAGSSIRRWLTYLTLFIAAAALVGDVITLVFQLLEGELSLRFFLKVLVVFVLAGMTFSYYLLSIRHLPGSAYWRNLQKSYAIGALSVVLIAIVWGAMHIGSPGSERQRKFDQRRVEDLQGIRREVFNIAYEVVTRRDEQEPSNPLPASIDEIAGKAHYQRIRIVDPETGVPYRYEVVSADDFSLCAVFSTVREKHYDLFWDHPVGEHCFAFNIRGSDRY